MKAHIKIEFDLDPADYHDVAPTERGVGGLVRAMIGRQADFPDEAFGGIKVELSGCPHDTDGDDRCGREDCPHCRPKPQAKPVAEEDLGEHPNPIDDEPLPEEMDYFDAGIKVGKPTKGKQSESIDEDDYDYPRKLHKLKQKCLELVKDYRNRACRYGETTRVVLQKAANQLERVVEGDDI